MSPASLDAAGTRKAVQGSKLLTDDQLAYWMLYPGGKEHSIDPMGFGVELGPIGRAAFRHRLAVDPAAAAKCECWEGDPPAVALFKPAWRASPSKKHAGWHVVIGPYDEGFLRDLKAKIWPARRVWVPALKAWRVHATALAELKAIIEEHSLLIDTGEQGES